LASVGKQNARRGDDDDHPLRVDQGYLRNGSPREKAHVHPEGCYPDQEIELMTGTTVTAIDPARSRITIDDGREPVRNRADLQVRSHNDHYRAEIMETARDPP
jgi:hypothetical protein